MRSWRPEITSGDVEALLKYSPYADDGPDERPYGWDFSEQLILDPPFADPD